MQVRVILMDFILHIILFTKKMEIRLHVHDAKREMKIHDFLSVLKNYLLNVHAITGFWNVFGTNDARVNAIRYSFLHSYASTFKLRQD